MPDKFDEWNETKKKLNQKTRTVFAHEREIWWCNVGVNIGYEQNGKGDKRLRPVVLLKKFNNHMYLAAPLSTTTKTKKFYFDIGSITGKPAKVVVSQLKLIDQKRLFKKICHLPKPLFYQLKSRVVQINFG